MSLTGLGFGLALDAVPDSDDSKAPSDYERSISIAGLLYAEHSSSSSVGNYSLFDEIGFNRSAIKVSDDFIKNLANQHDIVYRFPSPYSSDTRIMFTIMYVILIIMSVTGNTTVCYVVLRNKRMRSVTNFFLANQAFSDILMTFLNVPFIVIKELKQQWTFGTIPCHLVDFIGMMSVYVSVFTLTAIAVDRHRVIVHPLKPRITMTTAVAISIFIWAMAIILSLPHAIFRHLHVSELFNLCLPQYPFSHYIFENIMTYVTLLLQYVAPLVIITTSYVSIGHKLWSRTAVGDVIESQQAANARMKIRTTRMLVSVVAIFAICWFPIHMYFIVLHHTYIKQDAFLYLCLHWFAMFSVCVSPIAFCLLNENFRNDIKSGLTRFSAKLFSKKPQVINPGTTTEDGAESYTGKTIKSQDTYTHSLTKEANTQSEDIAMSRSTSSRKLAPIPLNSSNGKYVKLSVVPLATEENMA